LSRHKKDRGDEHNKRKTRREMYREKVKENIGIYINCCFSYPHASIVQQTITQRNLA